MSNLIQALRKPGNEISKWFYFKPPFAETGHVVQSSQSTLAKKPSRNQEKQPSTGVNQF